MSIPVGADRFTLFLESPPGEEAATGFMDASSQTSVSAAPYGGVTALESDLLDEVDRLARRAGDAFATRSALRDWLVCVLHQRLHGVPRRPGVRCDGVAAAACAIGFSGECPMASAPHEFDRVVAGLPTAQLEALLSLEQDVVGFGR
jgi:hypothetical protein